MRAVLNVEGGRQAGRLPGFEADEGRDGRLADLLDAVQRRYGKRALDYGGVRRTRWMGRKIAFDRVPG